MASICQCLSGFFSSMSHCGKKEKQYKLYHSVNSEMRNSIEGQNPRCSLPSALRNITQEKIAENSIFNKNAEESVETVSKFVTSQIKEKSPSIQKIKMNNNLETVTIKSKMTEKSRASEFIEYIFNALKSGVLKIDNLFSYEISESERNRILDETIKDQCRSFILNSNPYIAYITDTKNSIQQNDPDSTNTIFYSAGRKIIDVFYISGKTLSVGATSSFLTWIVCALIDNIIPDNTNLLAKLLEPTDRPQCYFLCNQIHDSSETEDVFKTIELIVSVGYAALVIFGVLIEIAKNP